MIVGCAVGLKTTIQFSEWRISFILGGC